MRAVTLAMLENMPDPSDLHVERHGGRCWVMVGSAVLAEYAEVARRTDDLVASLPDLNLSHPLPNAPWYQPGERRSARRVFLHIIAETAQHAGHADIIRESLDGASTTAQLGT